MPQRRYHIVVMHVDKPRCDYVVLGIDGLLTAYFFVSALGELAVLDPDIADFGARAFRVPDRGTKHREGVVRGQRGGTEIQAVG